MGGRRLKRLSEAIFLTIRLSSKGTAGTMLIPEVKRLLEVVR
jgi:hypothetical protein